jgi:hypothetical protein
MQNKIIILVGIIMLSILFMGTVSAAASTSDLLPQPAEITPESNQSIPLMKLTNETESFQEEPCVIFADDLFYVAYQSNKTGNYDIFIRRYDLNWIDFTEEQITTNPSNQYTPSIVFADKYLYIAYASDETGNSDIFVKKYDSDLNPRGKKKQITKDESYQGFPSIAFVKDYLYMAYGSNETGDCDIFIEKYDLNLTSVGGGKKQITFEENDQNDPSIIFADNCSYIAYETFEDGIDWDIAIKKYSLNFEDGNEYCVNLDHMKSYIDYLGGDQAYTSTIFVDKHLYITCASDGDYWNYDASNEDYWDYDVSDGDYWNYDASTEDYWDYNVSDEDYWDYNVSDEDYWNYDVSDEDYWNYDIFVQKYAPDLEYPEMVDKITDEAFKSDSPTVSSITFAEGNFYVVYSCEDKKGDPNIFMKQVNKSFFESQTAKSQIDEWEHKNPSIVFANNTFYVAYSSNQSNRGNYDIFVKQYYRNLTSKGDPKPVTNESFDEYNPSIVFADKHLHIVYDSKNKTGNYDIFVQTYDLNMALIGEPKQIAYNKTLNEVIPSIIFVNDSFYMVYTSIEKGNGDIFIRQYNSDWELIKEKQITNKTNNVQPGAFPSITYGNNKLYIAYHSVTADRDRVIFIERYDLNLNKSEERKPLTTHRPYQEHPSILFANNNLYLTYEDYYFGDDIFLERYDLFLERYDLNWRNVEKQITPAVRNDEDPTIIFMDDDLYVAYSSNEKGHYEINITKIEIPPFPLFPPIPKTIITGVVMMALIFFSVAIVYTKKEEIIISKRYKYLLLVFAGTILVMLGYALHPPGSIIYPLRYFYLPASDFFYILFLLTVPYMLLVYVYSKNLREFFLLVSFAFLILLTGSLIYYWSIIPITETQIEEILDAVFILSFTIIIFLIIFLPSRAAYPHLKKHIKEWRERMKPFVKIENPYIAGIPIRDKEMFFGREDVFKSLKQRFKDEPAKTNIFLHGGRRIGKTSALYQIKGGALGDKFIPVFIDLQAIGDMDTYGFFGFITQELRKTLEGKGIKMKEYAFDSAKESYTATFTHVLDDVSNLINDKQIILMFDETETIEERIRKGKFDSAIYLYFESIIQHKEKVSCIFTGSPGVISKKEEGKPLFRAADYLKITFLDKKYAVELIKNPVKKEFVKYNDKVIERILRITGHHPFYIQYICYGIVNSLNKEKRKKVKMRDIDTAIAKLIKGAPMHLSYVWETATYDEKIVLSLLSEIISKENEFVSASAIEKYKTEKEKKDEATITLSAKIDKILDDLHHDDILEEDPEHEYRYKVDLIRHWVKEYHSVWRVIDEE